METSSNNYIINIPNIIFKSIDGIQIVKLIQHSYYRISDNPDSINKLVIIYKLMYGNYEKDDIITSYIPYYISDGETNGLRINALLPFICFYQKNSKTCPIINSNNKHHNNYNLLFKYKICKNIDMNFIKDKLYKNTFDKDYYKGNSFKLRKNRGNDVELKMLESIGAGLYTFLGRIENVLDLIMCISSYKINIMNQTDMEDQLLYIPIKNKNTYQKYDEKYISSQEYFDDLEEELYNENINSYSSTTFTKVEYRYFLLKELKNLFNDLSNIEGLNITYIPKNIESFTYTTYNDFNDSLNPTICKLGEINEDANRNALYYFTISQITYDILHEYINKSIPNLFINIDKILNSNDEECKMIDLHSYFKNNWSSECKNIPKKRKHNEEDYENDYDEEDDEEDDEENEDEENEENEENDEE